ncbi:MAG TPA: outer membrane beta-barrel family protein, partial [Flavisolibacter sp.]
ESVEVITNPSAKFDASGGTAGILNIVLKKNRRVGYSGNVRANVDTRGRFGGGGDINIRQNKVNFFLNGMLNQRKTISSGLTERTTFSNGSQILFDQNDRSSGTGQFGFLRGGIDYFIDNRNTLTLNGTFSQGKMSPDMVSDLYTDSLSNSTLYPLLYQHRASNSAFRFRNRAAQLSYKHNFPKASHELTADITYNKSRNNRTSNITTDTYDMPGPVYMNTYRQEQIGSGNNELIVFQTDYSNPISEKSKIEMGARTSIRTVENEDQFYFQLPNGELKPGTFTTYNSTDKVYAAYATFSNRINKFGYQLGLRAESSDYSATVPTRNQSFSINFPVSLFPSVFLSQKVSDDQELQLNYSRRINRPNFWQLTPFIDSSDYLNINVGNPGLEPEFTNSLELSYSKTFKNRDNFLASVYFKNTTNLITRFQKRDTVISKEGLINTFINADRSYVTGLELTSRNKITKWWDLTSNANFFTAQVDVPGQEEQDPFPSFFIKLNNSFKLPKNFSLQISGDYQSKIVSSPGGGGGGRGGHMFGGGGNTAAQGYIRPNYGVDAAVRFEFLKEKRGSLSLNINDIFRTRLYDAHSEVLPYFVQDIQRRRDPQVMRLNFNWRFGKFDASLFKRKNTRADNNVNMDAPGF